MDFGKIISWFVSHRMFVGVVAIVVVLLAWEYMREQNARPAALGGVSDSRSQVSGQPTAQNDTDDDKDSIDALFDPSDARTAAKYKMPRKLSAPEIKQFTADASCANDYIGLWYGLVHEYSEVYSRLKEKQAVVFGRISSGKGFKDEQIPTRWRQLMDSGDDLGEIMSLGMFYIAAHTRFEGIRYRIIGGEIPYGDVCFVKWISKLSLSRISTFGPRVSSADQFQQSMISEGLMTQEETMSVNFATLTGIQQIVDDIYRKYDHSGGTPPKLVFQP